MVGQRLIAEIRRPLINKFANCLSSLARPWPSKRTVRSKPTSNNTFNIMSGALPNSRGLKAVLVDLSGTIHIEDTAIPGSQDAVEKLKQSGLKLKFVTNTTKEPLQTLYEKLGSLGFQIEKTDIFTSLTAARNVVERKSLRPLLFLEDIAKEDFTGISEDNPNAVVIGLAPSHFNYEKLTQAFRLIQDGAPLIAIHKARYFKKKDGMYLGPGAFVTGLEYCADVKAEVVGKPEPSFFLESLKNLDVSPEDTVMIGDDVRDDVGGAINAGMKGILVRTGKYRPGDESKICPSPTAVCDDFSSAVDWILANNHGQ